MNTEEKLLKGLSDIGFILDDWKRDHQSKFDASYIVDVHTNVEGKPGISINATEGGGSYFKGIRIRIKNVTFLVDYEVAKMMGLVSADPPY